MTITLPLPHAPVAGPSRPSRSFGEVEMGYNVRDSLVEVVQAVRAAKRIVVICGAGVSTAAQIPDFRSAQGLFSPAQRNDTGAIRRSARGKGKLKEPLPLVRGKQPAVRDLFHVKSIADEHLLPAHNHLLNALFEICDEATPTPFHAYLSTLNRRGQLLRCYTQNIDGLEEKAGLEVGLPFPVERSPAKRRRINPPPTPESRSSTQDSEQAPSTPPGRLISPHLTNAAPLTPPSLGCTPPRLAFNPYPRVIPLHGTLSTLDCTVCSHVVPFAEVHPLPAHHIPCPACERTSFARSAASARQRAQGLLRPAVVLYGEDHPQGHLIGRAVERDLKGLGGKEEKEGKVDLLLVAGTSLSIPGIKRMVKEMSRVLAGKPGVRTVYLNDDAPAQPKEWEGIFDVWVKGDIQHFVRHYLTNPTFADAPATPPKTPRREAGIDHSASLSFSQTSSRSTSSAAPKRKRPAGDSPASPVHTPIRRIKLTLSSASRPAASPTTCPVPVIPSKYWRSDSARDARGLSPSLTPLSDDECAAGTSTQ